jgi:hypothetical protein
MYLTHSCVGSVDIAGYNSPQCGTCYKVTYKGKSIFILGIDHTATGLNVSYGLPCAPTILLTPLVQQIGLKAMNTLTNGNAVSLGRVNAQVLKVGYAKCGLSHAKREDLEAMEFEA